MEAFVVKAEQKEQFKREVLPAGTYLGTLYSIVDLWTQAWEYMGESTLQRKIRLSWELPQEMRVFSEEKWPQPMALHWELTLSFWEKAHLNKLISSWRGKAVEKDESIDLASFIGKNCILTTAIKTSKKWADYNIITGVWPLMKGMEEKAQINEELLYTINMGMNDVFVWLPQFLKDKIQLSKEWVDVVPF